VALVAAVVVFSILALRGSWDDVRDELTNLSVLELGLAFVLGSCGLVASFLAWRQLLSGLGGVMRDRDAATTFFAAQLGKYVPGSVWPVVVQAEMGRRNGVARRVMFGSYVVALGVGAASGAVVSGLVATGGGTWWIVAVGSVVAGAILAWALLHPSGLLRWCDWALTRLRRQRIDARLSRSSALRACAIAFAGWVAWGIHAWVLARPFGAEASDLAFCVGGFALAFVAGLLALPLPAGAGVREAVLALTFGPIVGNGEALTIALLSRLLLVAAELLAATFTGAFRAAANARARSATGGLSA
jgi:hypothetical protein